MSKNERTCVVCGEVATKAELFRWVNAQGSIMLDWQGHFPGRGVYTHPRQDCVEKLYKKRSFPARFLSGKREFTTPFAEIFSHISRLSQDSFRHFCSLGIKSGIMTLGQEGITEKYETSHNLPSAVFVAEDISEKSMKKIPEEIKLLSVALPFGKEQLGGYLKGRPVGVVAVTQGSLSDRLSFYADIMIHFFSGDVYADK